jgi:hypothetical protein
VYGHQEHEVSPYPTDTVFIEESLLDCAPFYMVMRQHNCMKRQRVPADCIENGSSDRFYLSCRRVRGDSEQGRHSRPTHVAENVYERWEV